MVEVKLNNVIVVENLGNVKLFDNTDEVSLYYKIPMNLVKNNMVENNTNKLLGRGRTALVNKKQDVSIICMSLESIMRI